MHKLELIRVVARRAGLSQGATERVLAAVVEQIADTLADGDAVVWTGLARFETRQRAEKRAVNPRTGQPMTLPPKTTVGTRFAPTFKHRVKARGVAPEAGAAD